MENVERALTDGEQFFIDLEQMFERLDPVAWQMFKSRTAPYVHKLDEWGYSKQLFERFHEADGYGFLKSDGYQDIRFLPEDTGKPMPDLEARDQGRLVLMEVKTVNESDNQKRYFETSLVSRDALPVERRVPAGLRHKLEAAIAKAAEQLLSIQDPAVQRRIVYLFVRLDFHLHAVNELEQLLADEHHPGVEICWRVLRP